MKVTIVNNTPSYIRDFYKYFIDCVENNKPLPEELADLFKLEIVENGSKGIITAA